MSEGRPALQMLDSNMLRVREQASLEDKVQALEAVHSLREQAMRQQYKAQLNELLQDVADEESKYQELKQRHADVLDRYHFAMGTTALFECPTDTDLSVGYLCRQQELTAGVASLTVENRSLAAQVEHATSRNTELFAALEATQKANREQEAAAEAASAMHKRLRMAANTVAARLAGAEERARQLQSASSVRDRVLAALQSVALDGDAAEAIDSLSAQLDEALAQAAQAASHVATLDATVMQYEAHVKRLILEAGEQAARAKSKEEHTTQLQRLVAELQAEVQRLQSEASIGAPIVLDLGQGRLLPQAPDTAGGKPGLHGGGAGGGRGAAHAAQGGAPSGWRWHQQHLDSQP
ncbi:predicted protein [Haematococcus lacustris]|uniref:Uncharacterized protein n=1 Tax=Haematococcus lacustris TaxID=44745 RepID=A0A699Z330_HAELA|nr:predicted protein [Haematococcus lacustris]